jgi:hypothetical protein
MVQRSRPCRWSHIVVLLAMLAVMGIIGTGTSASPSSAPWAASGTPTTAAAAAQSTSAPSMAPISCTRYEQNGFGPVDVHDTAMCTRACGAMEGLPVGVLTVTGTPTTTAAAAASVQFSAIATNETADTTADTVTTDYLCTCKSSGSGAETRTLCGVASASRMTSAAGASLSFVPAVMTLLLVPNILLWW